MTRVVVSPRADIEIDGILDRLSALAGIASPSDTPATFRQSYERLEMFPAVGAPRPSLGRNIRIVVRVLDGRRNVTRRLTRS